MTDNPLNQFPSKAIARNSVVAVVQVFGSTVIMFALYRYLFDSIGAESLGTWSIVSSAANALRMGELGLSGSVVKYVAKYLAKNNPDQASRIIQTGFISLAVLLFLILLIIYPVTSWLFKFIFADTSLALARSLLPLSLVYLWLANLGGVYQAGLDGCVRTDLRSANILLGNVLVFVFAAVFVPLYGVTGLIYSQILQSFILVLVGWFLLHRNLPALPFVPTQWSLACFKEMLNYGYKVQIIGISVIMTEPVMKMLIGRFGGLDFAGYFDMALRLINQVHSLLLSANQTIVPVIARLEETTSKSIKKAYYQNFNLVAFFSLPACFLITSLSPIISELWIGSYNKSFVSMVLILSIGEAFHILGGPSYFFNLGTGKLAWNVRSHLIGLVIIFLFGGGLGYFFGGIGVVIGIGLSFLAKGLTQTLPYLIDNHIPLNELFPNENRRLIVAGVFGTGLFLSIYSISNMYGSFWLKFIGAVLTAGILILSMWLHPLSAQFLSYVKRKSSLFITSKV